MQSRLFALALALSLPSMASADMIPSCPPGQRVQMNPVPAGAMHHAGGGCVDDPAAEPETPPPEAPPTEPSEEQGTAGEAAPAPEAQQTERSAEQRTPGEAPPAAQRTPGEAAPAAQGGGCSVAGRPSGAASMALAALAGLLVAMRRSRALTARTSLRPRQARCARP